MFELGLALSFAGESARASDWHQRCQNVTSTIGESWWRSFSLWAFGLEKWRQGATAEAADLERESLRLKRRLDDQLGIGVCLEAMSWIAASEGHTDRAACLLGAADARLRTVGMPVEGIQRMWASRLRGVHAGRRSATDRVFRAAYASGAALSSNAAVAYALDETASAPIDHPRPHHEPLTRREREVSELVAEGLTNREIAARLVISVRTAEKHVDNVIRKLGASNRTQVAARVAGARVDSEGSLPGS
jgi:non-specific serine/threonine protein kinase